MRALVVVALMGSGCIHPDLIECTADLQCPQDTVCLADQHTCVDPRGVELPEGTLDFTSITCGASVQLTLPLSNHGITAVDFTAHTTLDTFSVEPTQGTVAPGGTVVLIVTATPAPEGIPGSAIEGGLEVETWSGITERRLSVTPTGGIAEIGSAVDFGEVALGASTQQSLVIANAGTAPFGVSLDLQSNVFHLDGDASATIAPMSSQMLTIDYAAPTTVQDSSSMLVLDYDRSLCQEPVHGVAVMGRATGDALLVSPSALRFSAAPCNAAAETLSVIVTNNLPTAQKVTPALDPVTNEYSVSEEPVMVPAGGSISIPVTRQPTPALATASQLRDHATSLILRSDTLTKTLQLSYLLKAPLFVLSVSSLELKDQNGVVGVSNRGTAVEPVTVTPFTQSMNGITVQFVDQIQPGPGMSDKLNAQVIAGEINSSMIAQYEIGSPGNCSGDQALEVRASVNRMTMSTTPN